MNQACGDLGHSHGGFWTNYRSVWFLLELRDCINFYRTTVKRLWITPDYPEASRDGTTRISAVLGRLIHPPLLIQTEAADGAWRKNAHRSFDRLEVIKLECVLRSCLYSCKGVCMRVCMCGVIDSWSCRLGGLGPDFGKGVPTRILKTKAVQLFWDKESL